MYPEALGGSAHATLNASFLRHVAELMRRPSGVADMSVCVVEYLEHAAKLPRPARTDGRRGSNVGGGDAWEPRQRTGSLRGARRETPLYVLGNSISSDGPAEDGDGDGGGDGDAAAAAAAAAVAAAAAAGAGAAAKPTKRTSSLNLSHSAASLAAEARATSLVPSLSPSPVDAVGTTFNFVVGDNVDAGDNREIPRVDAAFDVAVGLPVTAHAASSAHAGNPMPAAIDTSAFQGFAAALSPDATDAGGGGVADETAPRRVTKKGGRNRRWRGQKSRNPKPPASGAAAGPSEEEKSEAFGLAPAGSLFESAAPWAGGPKPSQSKGKSSAAGVSTADGGEGVANALFGEGAGGGAPIPLQQQAQPKRGIDDCASDASSEGNKYDDG